MKYRTTGAWGAGLGRNLTPAEVDTNFYDLDVGLVDLVDNPPTAVGISNITVSGANMTVHLEDGTTFGPFALPRAAFRHRGEWVASTVYFSNDLVSVASAGVYLILADHTSEGAFDEDLVTSEGAVYQLIFPSNNPVPISEITAADYDVSAQDANRYLRCTNALGCVIQLTRDFAPNDEITFRQCASGPLAFTVGDTGGVINVPDGYDSSTSIRGAVVTAKHIGDGEWDLFGLLETAT